MKISVIIFILLPFLSSSQDSIEKNDVEISASFTGGIDALNSFLSKKLRYPPKAIKKGLEGTVVVEFILEKSGELTNFKILPTGNEIFGNELIRVLKKSPNWIPGKEINENGEQYVVRQKISQEITFTLPNRN